MSQKMRPIRIAAAIVLAALAVFLLWKAVRFFPDAFSRFRERGTTVHTTVRIDTALFDQEPAGAALLTEQIGHRPLDSMLLKIKDSLGISRMRVSLVRPEGVEIPLYSLELCKGVPLAQRVLEFSDALGRGGWQLAESDERPLKSTWTWVARIHRGDTLSALVRGRASAEPAPGTFRLHLGFFARDSGRIPSLQGLPRGVLVALAPRSYSIPAVSGLLRSAGAEPALVAELETSREPVSLQRDRFLLQHREAEFKARLLASDSCRTVPRGLVLSDGDRGSMDPELARRLAVFAKAQGWWILDATGNSASLLREKALAEGVGVVGPAAPHADRVAASLAAVEIQAIAEGEASLLLPLDSVTVRKVVAYLPFLERKGIVVVPWPVSHPRARRD